MTFLHARGERGSIAPAVPIIAMALLLLGGLGAEEAARAGAQGIDVAASDLQLDPFLAEDRVNTDCHRVEQLGQVDSCRFVRIQQVSDDDPRMLVVVTEVKLSIQASLLSMVGVHDLHASAEARARPYEGVNAPES